MDDFRIAAALTSVLHSKQCISIDISNVSRIAHGETRSYRDESHRWSRVSNLAQTRTIGSTYITDIGLSPAADHLRLAGFAYYEWAEQIGKIMLRFKFGIAVVVLATALSTTAYAAKGGGGGGGGGHAGGGGGGGGHASGGGGAHFGGGGGSAHFSGGGGRAHFSGGGARHVSASPAISRSAVSPSLRGTGSRGNRSLAAHTPASNAVGQRTLYNSTEKPTRGANVNPNLKSNAVRKTLASPSVAGALRNSSALRNPNSRSNITASAATAGWHNGRDGRNGWWRHGNGGYGWVGPLYWPFAYYDLYGYAMWGYGYDDSFWGYGYGDIYAGIFAPYGYDDLAGYLPQYASGNPNNVGQTAPAPSATAAPDQLTQMCGADSRDIAGLPIDQFQQAIQPTEEQRAALDDLANASVKAAQDIKAACPSNIALTAPSRLAAMQQRIEAMIAGVAIVQPPLEKFYGLLTDEQKERLTALGNDQLQSKTTVAGSLGQNCGAAQPGVMRWPTAEIDQTVRPADAQRASLVALQNATTQAADLLKSSCVADDLLTPSARLAAVGKRLDTMLQAVKIVRSALTDFYGTMSDEQKAKFEAIGPQRTSQISSKPFGG